MALQSLHLLPSPHYHFQQSLAVVRNGIDDLDDIVDKLLLDDFVDEEILLEGGRGVDFDEPTFEVLIDHDIVAEQFEAVGVGLDRVHDGDE